MPIEGSTIMFGSGDTLPELRTENGPLQQSPFALKGETSAAAAPQSSTGKAHLVVEGSSAGAKQQQSSCCSKQPQIAVVSRPSSPTTTTRITTPNGRIIYRPIATRPVRPAWLKGNSRLAAAQHAAQVGLPQTVVAEFYDTAEQQGLSEEQLNEATAAAADWHRKWTCQDEANHTAPEEQEQQQQAVVAVVEAQEEQRQETQEEEEEEPEQLASVSSLATHSDSSSSSTTSNDYVFDPSSSMTGLLEEARLAATNPSPEDDVASQSNTHYSKRLRLDSYLSSSHSSNSSSNSGASQDQQQQHQAQGMMMVTSHRPLYKRRLVGEETTRPIVTLGPVVPPSQQEQQVQPSLVRPVAMRIERPLAMRCTVPADYYKSLKLGGPGGGAAVSGGGIVLNKPAAISHSTIPHTVLRDWRAASNAGSNGGHLSPLTLSSLGTNDSKRTRTPKPQVPALIEEPLVSSAELLLRRKDKNLPTEIIHTTRHRSHHRQRLQYATTTSSISMDLLLSSDEAVSEVDSDDSSLSCRSNATDVVEARDGLLHSLAILGGNVPTADDCSASASRFYEHLSVLQEQFGDLACDTRQDDDPFAPTVEGCWLTLTSPTYFGCLGSNDNDDPMYTLGRMAFDMFSPTNLVCSLQGNFNTVHAVNDVERAALLADSSVPKALRQEVEQGGTTLRTYNVVTAFTIEPNLAAYPTAPNKNVRRPIRGLMTTYGYTLPDPEVPNRHSVWITGGRMEPNNDPMDQKAWKEQFAAHPPKHGLTEQAKLLAVKLLMGATMAQEMNPDDGSMEYSFSRPLGGHGMAYIDVLYVDESLRVVRGHRGTVFCFSRLPGESYSC